MFSYWKLIFSLQNERNPHKTWLCPNTMNKKWQWLAFIIHNFVLLPIFFSFLKLFSPIFVFLWRHRRNYEQILFQQSKTIYAQPFARHFQRTLSVQKFHFDWKYFNNKIKNTKSANDNERERKSRNNSKLSNSAQNSVAV